MSTARRIFDDLLTLEVNVIVKPGMTARKMPEPPHALLDVIGDYDKFLCESAERLNPHLVEEGSPAIVVRRPAADGSSSLPSGSTAADGTLRQPLRSEPVPDVVSVATFDELRERAVEAEAVYRHVVGQQPDLDEGQGIILKRIYRNCDQLKGILAGPEVAKVVGDGLDRASAPKALPLTADEVLTVRKVWEVGTESIVMQTVAQLDGDIVTRIQRARMAATNATLHSLHREMVENALEHWQFLFQTVAQFTSKALQSFLSR